MSKVVLITGCSSGIGHDLAKQLIKSGYTVVATARRLETLNDIQADLKLALDVTQTVSIKLALELVLQHFGRIDALINNAGYAVPGAIEEVPEEQVRQIFDVNVFGVLGMIRAVTPHMRQNKSGRIINISSIAGKLSTPANGLYSATKFALESLSDALRLELAPFGIQVVLVEPGAIKTNFDFTSQIQGQDILTNPASPYKTLYELSGKFADNMRTSEPGPEVVSRVIQRAMEVPRAKARYLAAVSPSGRLVLYMRDFIWDFVARQMFKISYQG